MGSDARSWGREEAEREREGDRKTRSRGKEREWERVEDRDPEYQGGEGGKRHRERTPKKTEKGGEEMA